jgi:hypothetical protein
MTAARMAFPGCERPTACALEPELSHRQPPAAFFIGGDKGNAAELGRLKGELDEIEQTSVRKNCPIQFQRALG